MPYCLKKMFESTTSNSYNFWYYQSLLEVPYVTLNKYLEGYTLAEYSNFIRTVIKSKCIGRNH